MRYRSIYIEPDPFTVGKWRTRSYLDQADRVAHPDPQPLPGLGVFYSPMRRSLKRGFNELKASMIEKHEKEIAALQKSLKALQELELPT